MGNGFHEYDVPTGEEVDQILANLKNGVKFGLDRAKVSFSSSAYILLYEIGETCVYANNGLYLIFLSALVQVLSRHPELYRETSRP